MKKIVGFTALVCALSLSAANAFAGESTVSGGYAQSDKLGVTNKSPGFNLKYRYEWSDSALGAISSFTHTEDSSSSPDSYSKAQYYSLTAGPAYRLNDWASLYGLVGVGYGKVTENGRTALNTSRDSNSDYGFTYGAGLQLNPLQNVALDFSYEQSRVRSTDVGTWVAGVGYRF